MIPWIWPLIAVRIAVILAAVLLLSRKRIQTKSDYALLTLGLTLVALGIIFGDDRLIGYSFMRTGVLLSIISAIKSTLARECSARGRVRSGNNGARLRARFKPTYAL